MYEKLSPLQEEKFHDISGKKYVASLLSQESWLVCV